MCWKRCIHGICILGIDDMGINQTNFASEVQISIIVPVYKVEQYLDRCIKSILNQTFTNLELILVDDGSPDRCPEICDEWERKDSRIKVIHKQNGGAGAARNAGLQIASGKYIGFVDSDDWIEANMYQELHQLATKYDADMVICNRFDRNGKRIADKDVVIELWNKNDCMNHFFRVHGENDTHAIWNRLIKRENLKNFKFIEGRMNEDVHACYCFSFVSNKTIYTNKQYYHYVFNDEGVTNNKFTLKKLDLLYVWNEVQKLVEIESPEYKVVCEINMKRARFTLLSKMYIDGYDKNNQELTEIRKKLKKEVRRSFFELMKWKMPLSRKVLLALVCI